MPGGGGFPSMQKGSTRRMAQAGRSPRISAGHPQPGGDGSGKSLAQAGRVEAWPRGPWRAPLGAANRLVPP